MERQFFGELLTATATLTAILMASAAVFVSWYETARHSGLSERAQSIYKTGQRGALAAFFLGLLTTVIALVGLLGVEQVYWLTVSLFGLTLFAMAITGFLMWRIT